MTKNPADGETPKSQIPDSAKAKFEAELKAGIPKRLALNKACGLKTDKKSQKEKK